MSQLEIRAAQIGDANVISSLLAQLGYDTAPSKIEVLVSMAASGNNKICVGVLSGQVIAMMSVIFFNYFPSAEKLCRITSIIVDESVRGSGVGSKLIDYARSIALAEKCSMLEVTTSLRREQTQAYYESIGFQKTSYKYVQKLEDNA
ncbi:GNAT family N-acetyltransferase [uncultured Paraglaciecola sp.]|uniref:GNAT family N-acetyltransferase n=1 Tax=uncultured Paraglaciecola sp. TaxID=1765024 RepID=UPI002599D437|nr:GNAT family N-acetyltransferase [uncultured Paraglaciecola sp.]